MSGAGGAALRCGFLACALAACGGARAAAPSSAAPAAASASVVAPAEPARAGPTLRVRNNQEIRYEGPVQLAVELPDGFYRGGGAVAEVRGGVARALVALAPGEDVVLSAAGPVLDQPFLDGPLGVAPDANGLSLRWAERPIAAMALGFVVLPGSTAGPEQAVRTFAPIEFAWNRRADGTLNGEAERDGYRLDVTLTPYGAGWLDAEVRVWRTSSGAERAYVALVRRVATPEPRQARQRFNGRVLVGAESPDIWERDFWYTHGVDWLSWRSGELAFAATSGFTPAPTTWRDSSWVVGSHFYVWERTRKAGDSLYLISEIAGPNPKQSGVRPYAPIAQGDTIRLRWRLAVARAPAADWEESQLRAFAGHRQAVRRRQEVTIELGALEVVFGTSYFPFSTFAENFDYYRTPGLDRETFWPFSAEMWLRWREFLPRMRTDLHIIRAMGFERVRLHHLELLRQMDRGEALAFLDAFAGIVRDVGLLMMVDSEGPAEWIATVVGRYPDIITRVEIENEVLIPPIGPGDAERWKALYRAVKEVAPAAQTFLTSAGNHGAFERLRALGVPFDRVGLHAYKHGPEWIEAFETHALATGGYASDIGKPATLGEFNWKNLTRMSPEARRAEFAAIYESMLRARAIPEFYQFHFQETLDVNPALGRSGIRHYETIALDRRPKLEALELMRLIRRYTRADAPVREVPIEFSEVRFEDGSATAGFVISNETRRPLDLEVDVLAFDGPEPRLQTPARVRLAPGEEHRGAVALRLPPDARPGTYHHFIAAEYDDEVAFGWGIAANTGAPAFADTSVLGERVAYPQGLDVVKRVNWAAPLAVAFGADAPVLELEMAYLIGNTLQAATGQRVRISSTDDLPDSLLRHGTLILVGTGRTNPLIGRVMLAAAAADGEHLFASLPVADVRGGAAPDPNSREKKSADGARGVIALSTTRGAGHRLILTGPDARGVQAAATELVLRYWPAAKDAAVRVTGLERGAALGNRAAVRNPDPP